MLDLKLQSIESRATAACRLAKSRVSHAADSFAVSRSQSENRHWRILGPFTRCRELAKATTLLEQYVARKFDERVANGVLRVVEQFRFTLTDELQSLCTLQRELKTLVETCGSNGVKESGGEVPTDGPPMATTTTALQREESGDHSVGGGTRTDIDALVASHVLGRLQKHWPRLVSQFETQFVRDVLGPHGGLDRALTAGSPFHPQAAATLRRAGFAMVTRYLQEVNVAEFLFLDVNGGKQDALEQLRDWIGAAAPRLTASGARRLLLAVREGTEMSAPCAAIERATDQPCSVVFGGDGDVLFCYEVERVPLASVLAHLSGRSTRHAEIAARLHTRIDVAWTSIEPAVVAALRDCPRVNVV
jgi:hypothetical protein